MLRVRRFATVCFFETMFDATVVWDRTAAGVRGIRLRVGRAFVQNHDQPPRAARGGAFHHLGIETDDLDALVQRMTDHGCTVRNPVRGEKEFKYVMIVGPDDLIIELAECHEHAGWEIRTDGT